MKLVAFDVDARHFFITNLAPGWIFPAIQSTRHFQSLRRGGPGDEIDDRFVIPQRLSAPI